VPLLPPAGSSTASEGDSSASACRPAAGVGPRGRTAPVSAAGVKRESSAMRAGSAVRVRKRLRKSPEPSYLAREGGGRG
jgi:hypothetical protein